MYSKINYYKRQGVRFHSGIYPVLGSYLRLIQSKKEPIKGGSLVTNFVNNTYFSDGKEVSPFVGVVFGTTVSLYVNHPEAAAEIFIAKNKYFDKHPRSANLLKRFFGDSILFAKSDMLWQQKRKALSAALYKEKLRVMIDIIK